MYVRLMVYVSEQASRHVHADMAYNRRVCNVTMHACSHTPYLDGGLNSLTVHVGGVDRVVTNKVLALGLRKTARMTEHQTSGVVCERY